MRGGLVGGASLAERGGSALGWAAAPLTRVAMRPDLLMVLLGAVLLTYVWRFQDVIPRAVVLRPTLLIGLAILVAAVRVPPEMLGRRLLSPVHVRLVPAPPDTGYVF